MAINPERLQQQAVRLLGIGVIASDEPDTLVQVSGAVFDYPGFYAHNLASDAVIRLADKGDGVVEVHAYKIGGEGIEIPISDGVNFVTECLNVVLMGQHGSYIQNGQLTSPDDIVLIPPTTERHMVRGLGHKVQPILGVGDVFIDPDLGPRPIDPLF